MNKPYIRKSLSLSQGEGFSFYTELSHVVQVRAEGPKAPEAARPERAEAPSPGHRPGRALKKSPFLRTKTENAYDL